MDNQEKLDNAENSLMSAINQIKSGDVEIENEAEETVDVELDEPTEEPEKKEPRRSEFVETDDPKVLERINDLYGQVKKSDARNQSLIEHNKMLEQKLSEILDRQNKFETDNKKANNDKVETELRNQLKEAREEGDYDRISDLEDKLLDLRLERRLSERIKPEEKPKEEVKEVQSEQMTDQERYAYYLGAERTAEGNLVRPWLQDWHPDNEKALKTLNSVREELIAAGKNPTVDVMFKILDERMNGKPRPREATVLSGEGGPSPKKTVKLTRQQAEVARKMGISAEAYARQLSVLNS